MTHFHLSMQTDQRRQPPRLAGAVLAAVTLMTACGGGGGGGVESAPPDTGVPAQATAVITSSAAAATALVRDAEQRTRDLQLASGLAGATTPTSTPAAALPGVTTQRLQGSGMKQIAAVQNIASDLCSSGSASVDVADALFNRFAADPNARLMTGDRLAFSATACVVKAAVELGADVALGNFGVGATISGNFVLDAELLDANNQVLKLTYTGFRWQPLGEAAFDALDAVIRFGTQAGAPVFSLDLPGRKFLEVPLVVAQGGRITVSQGSLRAAVPATSGTGYGDYAYAGWRYATATGRADAGTVTVRGAGTTLARITASPGGYSVDITANGSTQTYAVAL